MVYSAVYINNTNRTGIKTEPIKIEDIKVFLSRKLSLISLNITVIICLFMTHSISYNMYKSVFQIVLVGLAFQFLLGARCTKDSIVNN